MAPNFLNFSKTFNSIQFNSTQTKTTLIMPKTNSADKRTKALEALAALKQKKLKPHEPTKVVKKPVRIIPQASQFYKECNIMESTTEEDFDSYANDRNPKTGECRWCKKLVEDPEKHFTLLRYDHGNCYSHKFVCKTKIPTDEEYIKNREEKRRKKGKVSKRVPQVEGKEDRCECGKTGNKVGTCAGHGCNNLICDHCGVECSDGDYECTDCFPRCFRCFSSKGVDSERDHYRFTDLYEYPQFDGHDDERTVCYSCCGARVFNSGPI